jgi:hypothetical protein
MTILANKSRIYTVITCLIGRTGEASSGAVLPPRNIPIDDKISSRRPWASPRYRTERALASDKRLQNTLMERGKNIVSRKEEVHTDTSEVERKEGKEKGMNYN